MGRNDIGCWTGWRESAIDISEADKVRQTVEAKLVSGVLLFKLFFQLTATLAELLDMLLYYWSMECVIRWIM